MTHYLKFPDEQTGLAALDAAGLLRTDEDGDQAPITASLDHALDVVGVIYRAGTFDAETGEVITPPIPRPAGTSTTSAPYRTAGTPTWSSHSDHRGCSHDHHREPRRLPG